MTDDRTARNLQRAREILAKRDTAEEIAARAKRQERLRKETADARIDAAVARARAEKSAATAPTSAAAPAPAAKVPPPAVKSKPSPRMERKHMNGVKSAVADAVAREIADLRRERELQAAKIDAALSRVDAALARAEVGGTEFSRRDRMLNSRMIVTR